MTFHYWKHMLLLLATGPVLMTFAAGPQRLHVGQMGIASTDNTAMGAIVEDGLHRLDLRAKESAGEPLDPVWVQDSFERLAKGVSSQEEALSKMAETWTPLAKTGTGLSLASCTLCSSPS